MPQRRLSTKPRPGLPGYLMVAPWSIFRPGGVSGVVAGLGAALMRSGQWDVHYLELAQADSSARSQDGSNVLRRRIRSWPAAGAPIRPRLSFMATLPHTLARAMTLIRRHGIRVVNVHYPTPEAWLFAALRRSGLFDGQLVLSVHGLDVHETLRSAQGLATMRWIYAAADAVVACSHSLAHDLVELLPELAGSTYTVHNGIDATASGSPVATEWSSGATADRPPTLLSVATFEPKKGLDVLLEAFAACRARRPALRLRMIGQRHRDDVTFDRIVARVAELGLEGCVEIATDVSNAEVLAAMRMADVLVLPSRREPFGLVLLEAGLVGTPIVATHVGGIPEVMPSADHGLLVPPEDPDALAVAIESILNDPAAARQRALNMQQRVLERFTWDHAAEKYRALLQNAQGTGNSSRVRPDAR